MKNVNSIAFFWAFSAEKREYDEKILVVVYDWMDGEITYQEMAAKLGTMKEDIDELMENFIKKIRE